MRGERYQAKARGTACEHLVEADLLLRGLEVTRPSVDYGDDLHARFSSGWHTVQVKSRDRRATKWIHHGSSRETITSDILALVDPYSREIRYQAVGRKVLPPELTP